MTPIYIPLDLQINTLLRLPAKSLLRFRCVSKLWFSIITSHDFKKRHSDIASSSDPSRLLITLGSSDRKELLLVSSPKPYVSSSSSCCVPYKDLSLLNIPGRKVYNAVRGLFCFESERKAGICNPNSGELHIFPQIKFKTYREIIRNKYFFGYDPVEVQYKVLAIDDFPGRLEHKVMVLGKEEAWREAPCVAFPHLAHTLGLYMNGTPYYGASRRDIKSRNNKSIIVSFDVRLETFDMINVPSKVIPMESRCLQQVQHPQIVTTNSNQQEQQLSTPNLIVGVVAASNTKADFPASVPIEVDQTSTTTVSVQDDVPKQSGTPTTCNTIVTNSETSAALDNQIKAPPTATPSKKQDAQPNEVVPHGSSSKDNQVKPKKTLDDQEETTTEILHELIVGKDPVYSSSEDTFDEHQLMEETLQRKSTRDTKPTLKAREMQRSSNKGRRGKGRRGRGHR